MKKLIVAAALSLFALSVSSAALACDGMKGQHGSQTQASKGKSKDGKTKKDEGSGEATKS